MRLRHLITALAATLALSGCGILDWFSTSNLKPTELTDIKPSLNARIVWRTSISNGAGLYLQPAVAENAVYVAAANGDVLRLAPDTGQQVWKVSVDARITGGVGSDGFTVAVGTARGEVIVLGADGKELWRAQVTSDIQSPPLVGRGLVVVRSSDYRVTAFDATTGRRRWSFLRTVPPLTLRVPTEMVFAGDYIVAGYPNGRLMAFVTNTGAVRWDVAVSDAKGSTEVERLNDVVGAPLVLGADVCAPAFQGRVACFEIASGTQRWARDISAGPGMGGDESAVYVVDSKSEVVAFGRAAGANMWRQTKLTYRRASSPLALRKAIAVGDLEGYVHFLLPDNGDFGARLKVDSAAIVVQPRLLAGGALVQTQDGTLVLINLDS